VQKSTQGTACVGSGGQHPGMWQAFVGADAIGSGRLTRGQLRWNYTAVHPVSIFRMAPSARFT